jgi:hypothetical protein
MPHETVGIAPKNWEAACTCTHMPIQETAKKPTLSERSSDTRHGLGDHLKQVCHASALQKIQ